jgi:hypothetical protein
MKAMTHVLPRVWLRRVDAVDLLTPANPEIDMEVLRA